MKLNLYQSFCLLSITLLFITGCEKDYESIEEVDALAVQTYIKNNNLSLQQYKNTGIYYQVINPGVGDTVKYTDQIYATFTVKSLDGKFSSQADSLNRFSSFLGYFSSSNDYPAAFSTTVKEILNRKNGVIRIIIPSHLAYGRGGSNSLSIPGNASLDCTITLYDVKSKIDFEDVFLKRYFQSSKINIASFTRTNTGLYYQVITPGAGTETVNEGSLITVSYTGKLTNGTIFDQSTSYEAYLSNLIPGWKEGIPQINKGGKIRLIVPPGLAYGGSASSAVPSFSTLDFVIELLDVK